MIRVLLVVPLALLAVIPSASAAEAQRWQGMTSQGLAMDFVVKKAGGKTVIASWEFEFTLLCLKSGNIIDLFTGFRDLRSPRAHQEDPGRGVHQRQAKLGGSPGVRADRCAPARPDVDPAREGLGREGDQIGQLIR